MAKLSNKVEKLLAELVPKSASKPVTASRCRKRTVRPFCALQRSAQLTAQHTQL